MKELESKLSEAIRKNNEFKLYFDGQTERMQAIRSVNKKITSKLESKSEAKYEYESLLEQYRKATEKIMSLESALLSSN